MPAISPFSALMPDADNVDRVSAVPYDVVDRDEAAALAEGNPLSLLHASRPEIDLPPETDPYADQVYEAAAAAFDRLRREAPLTVDDAPHLYVYAINARGHCQTGLMAAADVDDYDSGAIRIHEKTRRTKEDDRTRHILATRSHSGPVFLLYRACDGINSRITDICAADPHFDFTAEDGSRHRLWRCPDEHTAALQTAFAEVPCFYVADGHHRAKAASRTREECRAANPDHRGDEAYNRFLCVLFPHDQLRILPYNRVVHDLNGHTPEGILDALKERFALAPTQKPAPEAKGRVHVYLQQQWYRLELPLPAADQAGSVAETLDAAVLQEHVLAPLLGIDDPRRSTRIEFVGGIHGPERLVQMVDDGRGMIAFSMFPTSVDELMAISDNDEIMPPKSTWFEPKLRDGLAIHCF